VKRLLTLILPLVLPFTFVLGACGGDGDDSDARSDDDTTTETDASGDGDDSDDGDDSRGDGGEVPDPCTLIRQSELTFLLDGDPGEGTEQAPVPDQRRVCTYDSGLILAVEVAANYQTTVDLIGQSGGSVQEVPGIGQAAVWQEIGGGAGQFVALGDEYFIGVTLSSGGQTVGQFVAEAMLAAL